jgi:GT2 family glycosyltransferase
MAEKLRDHPDAVLVYSDEDKLDEAGNRCDPHFKPDFDPDRLLGHNYVAHLLVARRSEVIERGGFRVGFEGSQDHDLVLRLVAQRTADVVLHVPEVLYHWRKHERSTAAQLASKPYALEAGRRAVVSHLGQQRLDARVDFDEPGQSLRVRWALPPAPPRVSIIVPTRDGQPHLSRCIRTLLDFTDYPDFEILIVDNGSRDERTLRYLEHAEEDEHVVVWRDDRPFNFSRLNNFAVTKATGRVLAFVNDDIQATEPGWLREMVSNAIRPDIGAVGAKLLYPDGRIQHGGVVLGIGGIAGHAFKFSSGLGAGYFSKLRMTHTVSAVTAACMVIERRKFEQVGRFDEEHLQVAFNDVDLCLRLRQSGFRNLLAPHAVLVHQESASRGSDETVSNRERFAREQRIMRERWQKELDADPYYSPNLSNEFEDFSLRTN